ncbi:TonB-dependent receptor [Chitinimonas sp. BJYL2]|uniref:TonB-dependent receptor n=1 Tax=Chitinimonas sp. BJYL2 TaxID=2976696 RepID=UPI0022B5CECF|nr:TonB-dependent receptor [Chitinimonas sp. BJYL2]
MFRPNRLSIAVSLALLGGSIAAQAAADDTTAAETVQITGIRASLQQSITAKKNAASNVEIVTAEDVGKMPDKNIADALSRLSGVNVQYGGALAMDEAERIAIRGTSPNLNLTTVNGHALSSGDWHVGDQAGSGRSVGFGLMPSQLIARAVVNKTGMAELVEGGIAGNVDLVFRKPLDFKKPLTGDLSVGLVYAELANKTDPQVHGLVNWKNDSNTFGVLLQAFKEDRHLRRDGQETFSFTTVSKAVADRSGNPALEGKRLPGSLNSALFEGVRERSGGYLGLQFKPSSSLDINASIFSATLDAENYNSSAYALPGNIINNGGKITNYTVEGDVITKATLVRDTTRNPVTQPVQTLQFDHNNRAGAQSKSAFYDLDVKYKATDSLTLSAKAGYTEGSGVTQNQPSLFWGLYNTNMSYQINTTRPTDYSLFYDNGTQANLSTPAELKLMNIMAAAVESTDEESYLHLDGAYELNLGWLTKAKFGVRSAEHTREYKVWGGRFNALDPVAPTCPPGGLACFITSTPTPATGYPGNYADGLNAAFPRDLFRYHPDQIKDFSYTNANWDRNLNRILTSGYKVEEKNQAAYAQVDYEFGDITGNLGLRYVKTDLASLSYQALPAATCGALKPCNVPGAIVGSRYATYLPQLVESSHTAYLPSLNTRWDMGKGVISRLGLTRTLGRANYSELAGAVSLNDVLLTGSSGNPNLKPITSNNVDLSLAWYTGPRQYVQGAVFMQKMKDYVKPGTSDVEYYNLTFNRYDTYKVSSRIGVRAKIRGLEIGGETPIGNGFGLIANATYAKGEDAQGARMLGVSDWTYNLRGYYEDGKFNASLAYNYRTDYAIGLLGDGSNVQPGISKVNGAHFYKGAASLSASVGYKINDTFSVQLDANNLTDEVRHTYFIDQNAPGYWHQNGRQYFLSFKAKY